MKSGNGHQEEEDEVEEELGGRKAATPSNSYPKDGKHSEKANAIRSKHSVTEQRRRSKINERFQILRELIPHSDQKRDTATFLLEVIQYVQYLQEKIQKYEGSFQNWNTEPTKLMPWRNSHWSMHSAGSQPQGLKDGSSSGPAFPGHFDETNISVPPTIHSIQQSPMEHDLRRDVGKEIDHQNELASQTLVTPMPLAPSLPVSLQNDPLCFSVVVLPCYCYGEESNWLLNSLTGALQSTGLDLSQATISVQINLGKQSNRELLSGLSIARDPDNPMPSSSIQSVGRFGDTSNGEESHQAQKRKCEGLKVNASAQF